VEPPRPLDAQLEGYAWLPRMLDKARAALAGRAGDYLFGCPVDHTCMARLGVSPELVLALAAERDDLGVLEGLRAHGIPSASDAWFDAVAVEDELQDSGIYLHVRRADQLDQAPQDIAGGRVFAGGEHGAEVSVALLELEAGVAQEPHRHRVAEVLTVYSGAAVVTLGHWQARIVHAARCHGPLALGAVAAYGASAIVTEPAGAGEA
jgi:mannose-6-phosphate isomerase-like protein (cupin superfamily)